MDFHHISQIFVHTAYAATEAATETAEGSGGVSGTLGLNWKLFAAQLVNFGILLVVLWKFVFIPVAKKMQERTSKIDKSLKDAQDIEVQKKQFAEWKDQEMAKARKQAAEVITASQTEAGKVRQQILDQAKAEQEKLVKQAKEQIASEKNQALSDIKSQVADMITGAAEKILRKNLDAKADKEFIEESLNSIK